MREYYLPKSSGFKRQKVHYSKTRYYSLKMEDGTETLLQKNKRKPGATMVVVPFTQYYEKILDTCI